MEGSHWKRGIFFDQAMGSALGLPSPRHILRSVSLALQSSRGILSKHQAFFDTVEAGKIKHDSIRDEA